MSLDIVVWSKYGKVEAVTLDTVDRFKKGLDRVSKPCYDFWVIYVQNKNQLPFRLLFGPNQLTVKSEH